MYIGTPYVWLNSCSIDGFALVLLVICYDSALVSNMFPSFYRRHMKVVPYLVSWLD